MVFAKLLQKVLPTIKSSDTLDTSDRAFSVEPPAAHVWGKSTASAMAVHSTLNIVALSATEGIVKLVAKDFEVTLTKDIVVAQLWFVGNYLVGLAHQALAIWSLEDTNKPTIVKLPFEVWYGEPAPEAEVILLGTSEGNVHSVDVANAVLTNFSISYLEHGKGREKSGVTCMAMNEMSKDLLIGFEDGFVSRYNIEKRALKKGIPGEHVVASVMWLRKSGATAQGPWHFLVLYANGALDEYETQRKRRVTIEDGTELLGCDLDCIWCACKEGVYTLTIEEWKRSVVLSTPLADAAFIPPLSQQSVAALNAVDGPPGCVGPIGASLPPWSVDMSSEERPHLLESLAYHSMVLVLTEDQRMVVHGRFMGWEFEWGSIPWAPPATLAFHDFGYTSAAPPPPPPPPPPSEAPHGASSSSTNNGRAAASSPRGTVEEPASKAWVNKCFNVRLAHFEEFLSERRCAPTQWNVTKTWNHMLGSAFGVYLSGHEDGTCRVWLACQSTVLLVHVVSLAACPVLTYRPRYKQVVTQQSKLRFYDGVDACPSFSASEEWGRGLTSICFTIAAQQQACLALGGKDGAVGLFIWKDEVEPMTKAEQAELQVLSMLEDNPEEVTPPTLVTGFVCVLRPGHHKGSITGLAITGHTLICVDEEAMISVTDFNGDCIFLDDCAHSGPIDLTRVAIVAAEGLLVLSRESSPSTSGTPPIAPRRLPMPHFTDGNVNDGVIPTSYYVALSNGSVREVHRDGLFFEVAPPSKEDNRVELATSSACPEGVLLLLSHVDGEPIIVRTRALFFKGQVRCFEEIARAAQILSVGPSGCSGQAQQQRVLAVWFISGTCHFLSLPDLVGQDGVVDAKNLIPGGFVHICSQGRALACSASRAGPSVQLSLLSDLHPLDESALQQPRVFLGRMVVQLRAALKEKAAREEAELKKMESSASGFLKSIFQSKRSSSGLFHKEKKPLRILLAPPPPTPARRERHQTSGSKELEVPGSRKMERQGSRTMPAQSMAQSAQSAAESSKQRIVQNLDQLAQLGDKTDKMQQDGAEFLRLAKTLNKKQSSRWF